MSALARRKEDMNRCVGAAVLSAVALASSGCVSAGSQSGTAQGQVQGPSARDARCDVVPSADLGRILSEPFTGPINTNDSTEQIPECQWTGKSGTSLVLVSVADTGANFLFKDAQQEAARNLGKVAPITVPGADRAYSLLSFGRIGMMVGDRYVESTTLVPGASTDDVVKVAALAAAGAAASR
jgi:hypothetical protein